MGRKAEGWGEEESRGKKQAERGGHRRKQEGGGGLALKHALPPQPSPSEPHFLSSLCPSISTFL